MNTLQHVVPRWLVIGGLAIVAAGANVLLGRGAAVGHEPLVLALLVGVLPAALIGFGALVEAHRALLAWIALFLMFTGAPLVAAPLPIPGGTTIYITDVLLLLTVGAWLASRLSGGPPARARLSVIFTWPLALFALAMFAAVLKGHERYGAGIVGQPLRIVLFAGIALALTDVTAASAWKAITRVFYAGAVLQSLAAAYYLATGTSQTHGEDLSTGGLRVIALSTAIYLTGSMICALLNLELERQPIRQLGHAMVAGLALFGVIISFGRTTFAAVALIVPLLFITRRYLRRTILLVLPLFLPLLALLALVTPNIAPDVLPTLERRIFATSSQDLNVRWREEATDAVLEGVDTEWLTGVGFGRTVRFVFEGRVRTLDEDPHNSYVFLLAGGGVLALGTFLLICVLYVADAVRRLRGAGAVEQALIIWALGFWLTFMVNALAGPVLPDHIMLLTIWILFALPSVVQPRRAPPNVRPVETSASTT